MDQVREESALSKIEGYFIKRPNESDKKTFERSKSECIKFMKMALQDVESIDFDNFKRKLSSSHKSYIFKDNQFCVTNGL